MKTLWAIGILAIALMGCSLLVERFGGKLDEVVAEYCTQLTEEERQSFRDRVNAVLQPNSLSIHCEPDTLEETSHAAEDLCSNPRTTGILRYVCAQHAHRCGPPPQYCNWTGTGPETNLYSRDAKPLTASSPTGTARHGPTMTRPLSDTHA